MVFADGFGPGLVATSPDGRLLAYSRSNYQQKDIYLWDLEHGADLGWLGTEEGGAALLFRRTVIVSSWHPPVPTGKATGSCHDWPSTQSISTPGGRRPVASPRRELTADEWRLYLGVVPQDPACSAAALAASRDAS